MPESGPPSRLTSPRALGAMAGALVVVAIVVVLVFVVGGSSKKRTAVVVTQKAGQLALPAIDRSRQNVESIYTAGTAILTDPAAEIKQAHALGFQMVRVDFAWGSLAPDPTARVEPHFDASNPAAYAGTAWAPYDTIVRLLHHYGMGLDLVLAPYAPRWAEAAGAPRSTVRHPTPTVWRPDPAMFKQFVTAVATRYSGHYRPKGQSSPLPRADFWSVWNEPNSGQQLAPQTAQALHPLTNGTKLNVAPASYRALADAAWSALHATGHGSDTITIGDLAPIGGALNGDGGFYSQQTPLRFLRALYCVDASFRPLRGSAATDAGCPATATASAKFATANPVLFHATAFADHPYPYDFRPDQQVPGVNDDVVLASLPALFTTLDRVTAAYGSHRHYDVYDLEYGYQTAPPNKQSGFKPALAAKYLNWSEYLSWRLPRVLSYDQYLLEDPPPTPHSKAPYQKFATGLETYSGKRKPGWYAFRMPIWLPETSQAAKGKLEVWGCVRPAKNYPMSKRAPAEIQLRTGGHWKTIADVSTKTSHGYFDVEESFPSSGTVRIKWSPPSGPAMYSRTTPITVK